MPLIKKKDYLKHYGRLGMRWGVRKRYDNSPNSRHSSGKTPPKRSQSNTNVVEINRKILKKNPETAVLNWDAIKKLRDTEDLSDEQLAVRDAKRKKVIKVAIGVGVGLGVVAGAYLYATHKNQVDGALKGALNKIGNKKLKDLEPQTAEQIQKCQEFGLKHVKTKQDLVNANWVATWIVGDQHRYDPISDEAFDLLDDNDLSVKSGQIFKRITKNPKEILGNFAYTSFEEDDNNRYKAFFPSLRKVNAFGEKTPQYSMTMESLEELRSPSAKKRVKILADLIENDSSFRTQFEIIRGENEGLSGLSLAKKHYGITATELVDRKNNMITDKYFKELKRLGYNALVDDNDAGRLTKNPLIVFNSSSLRQKGIEKITQRDINEALSRIKPLEGETWDNTYNLLMGNYIRELATRDPKMALKTVINSFYNSGS